ncbi:uncharacterized protein BO96DRAFT_325256 [Aspergillus niger CBS 101883]|uniref:Uncharacterized protein n=3 Tax=Aspergillus niger TaxID=5061 RepID=A2QX63_ASPNC|nr:uncharacterized protein BO96DRAFT_325256 [Aspergillus niger CBS 101883]XP_059604315.1 hypothetical protein An11g07770 [Aspergillus niger]PYH61795.1 hypothetical protein BO96DRAFT_325256 [Aspergillus niger CBS 101883]RDH16420.1 hypothetical protein M747DRAFT_317938 [Aspergillus niger ATCC 13496]CAK45971.1 hypothetical protein An11g07770 [Aspergillus niger]
MQWMRPRPKAAGVAEDFWKWPDQGLRFRKMAHDIWLVPIPPKGPYQTSSNYMRLTKSTKMAKCAPTANSGLAAKDKVRNIGLVIAFSSAVFTGYIINLPLGASLGVTCSFPDTMLYLGMKPPVSSISAVLLYWKGIYRTRLFVPLRRESIPQIHCSEGTTLASDKASYQNPTAELNKQKSSQQLSLMGRPDNHPGRDTTVVGTISSLLCSDETGMLVVAALDYCSHECTLHAFQSLNNLNNIKIQQTLPWFRIPDSRATKMGEISVEREPLGVGVQLVTGNQQWRI